MAKTESDEGLKNAVSSIHLIQAAFISRQLSVVVVYLYCISNSDPQHVQWVYLSLPLYISADGISMTCHLLDADQWIVAGYTSDSDLPASPNSLALRNIRLNKHIVRATISCLPKQRSTSRPISPSKDRCASLSGNRISVSCHLMTAYDDHVKVMNGNRNDLDEAGNTLVSLLTGLYFT